MPGRRTARKSGRRVSRTSKRSRRVVRRSAKKTARRSSRRVKRNTMRHRNTNRKVRRKSRRIRGGGSDVAPPPRTHLKPYGLEDLKEINKQMSNMRPKAPDNHIYVVSYSGTITGGKELRLYNENVVSKLYGKGNTPGTLLHYYDKYDNSPAGKKNEPFFDAFLVHMAHLRPESYNSMGLNDISYFKEEVLDDDSPNIDPKSKFKVNITENDHRENIRRDYSQAKHIFILSPFTEYMVDEINRFADHRNTPLIIHIQGAPCDGGSSNNGGLTSTGGGLFGEAFNLFSGGLASQRFRKSMLDKGGNFVSVSPYVNSYVLEDELYNVPQYYVNVNQHILDAATNNTVPDIFDKLNVLKVYQDGTDKDNLASLNLMNLIYNDRQVPADFIGFRIYASSSLPIMFKFLGYSKDELSKTTIGYVSKGKPPAVAAPSADQPGDDLVMKISQLSFFPPPLNFVSPMDEFMKPAGDYGTGNVRFEEDITKRFYQKQYYGFKEILDQSRTPGYGIELRNVGSAAIVDGVKERSDSNRSPFNMSLYFFAPDTYMSDALIAATGATDLNAAKRKIMGPTVLREPI